MQLSYKVHYVPSHEKVKWTKKRLKKLYSDKQFNSYKNPCSVCTSWVGYKSSIGFNGQPVKPYGRPVCFQCYYNIRCKLVLTDGSYIKGAWGELLWKNNAAAFDGKHPKIEICRLCDKYSKYFED